MSTLIATISNLLAGRRSLENPSSSLSDPDEWVFDAFGGERSSSGVRVNRRTALSYAAVKRAVDMISRDIAKLPLNVFERIGELSRRKDTDHPAYQLLRYTPNPEMIAYKWLQVMMNHSLIEGNHYSFVLRNGAGRPMEIWPLNPDVTFPFRVNGELFYVTTVDSEDRLLFRSDVIHITGLSYDGIVGIRLLDLARETFGHGIAMQRYGSKFFSNDARPGAVIEHPGNISEPAAQRLRKSWDRLHSGLENAHRTAVLEEGMKLSQFSINASDAQLVESQDWNVKQVANMFNVPAHKLGDDTRTSFASLEQENQSYLDSAIDPWLVQIEQVLRDRLLTDREKNSDSHFVEFNRMALVRTDSKTKSEVYKIALGGAPYMTRNEVRARENLNEIEGGDEILDPLNMTGGDDEPNDETGAAVMVEDEGQEGDGAGDRTAGELPTPEELLEAMKAEHRHRCLGRLQIHAERAAKEPSKFFEWLDQMEQLNRPQFEELQIDALRGRFDFDSMFSEVRDAMLTASECQPLELSSRVRTAFARLRG